jgi:predicted hydrolase (HD superfamily)
VAAALIHPDKKLASIDSQFILNRFGEKQFARGANRDQIASCNEELGINLEEFIEIGLRAMQEVAVDLGL